RAVYSDLGFIVLGLLIERLAGMSLPRFLREVLYQRIKTEPLGFISEGGFQPPMTLVAPTEEDHWRGRMLRAEVHDENAYALGGAAGHAGLFGTAKAVAALSGC